MTYPPSDDLIDARRKRLEALYAGAETRDAYEQRVLKIKPDRRGLEGPDRRLPHPYNKGGLVRERDVLAACKAVLKDRGIWHRRIDGTGKVVGSGDDCRMIPGELRGMPDLLACWSGRMVALEVKAPGGKISAIQWGTLRGIHDAGGLAIVACDGEALNRFLESGQVTARMDGWLVVL